MPIIGLDKIMKKFWKNHMHIKLPLGRLFMIYLTGDNYLGLPVFFSECSPISFAWLCVLCR